MVTSEKWCGVSQVSDENLKPENNKPDPLMTLGSAAAAGVRCRECGRQVEPITAEMTARYGAEMTVPDWREGLVCSRCSSRQVDMVVSGTERSP